MGNIQFHSESSARKFGGVPEDYLPIHQFLDQSKLYIADWRHRSLLHHTLGISICEQMFGPLFQRPSDQVKISTRTVTEVHILEDLGAILTPGEFLREMPIRAWMNGLNPQEKRYIQNIRIERRQGEDPQPPELASLPLAAAVPLQTGERAMENSLPVETLLKHAIRYDEYSEERLGIVGCKGCSWVPRTKTSPTAQDPGGDRYVSYYQQWVEHLQSL